MNEQCGRPGNEAAGTGDRARTRDGRTLYFERSGAGSPIVVFESGMGASRNEWGAVAPAVAGYTTAVVYDRSGLGRSPRDPAPRVLSRLVDDLLDLLAHLGDGPFVLVGHSWGGPIVRAAAAQVPDRVAGLVLVDQTDEGCDLFFSKANERQVRISTPLLPMLARLGIMRIAVRRFAAQLPEPAATAMRAEDGSTAASRTLQAEVVEHTDDLGTLRDAPPVLPDVPVTLISGTLPSRLERGRRGELIKAHRARADALPQGRHVTADRSGHYIPLTEPELIVDEVLRIVDAARSDGPDSPRRFS